MRHYVENETYASFATSTFYLPGSSQFQNKKISQQITCYDFPNRCCFTTNLISAEDGTDRISPSVITQIYKNIKYRIQTEYIEYTSSHPGPGTVWWRPTTSTPSRLTTSTTESSPVAPPASGSSTRARGSPPGLGWSLSSLL